MPETTLDSQDQELLAEFRTARDAVAAGEVSDLMRDIAERIASYRCDGVEYNDLQCWGNCSCDLPLTDNEVREIDDFDPDAPRFCSLSCGESSRRDIEAD